MTKIWKDNLATALDYAIQSRKQEERSLGYRTESSLVAGWIKLRNELRVENECFITFHAESRSVSRRIADQIETGAADPR